MIEENNAPAVERQSDPDCEWCGGCGHDHYGDPCTGCAQSEVSALQSTISRLEARVAELESGRGEADAWALVNGGGLIRDLTDRWDVAKHWEGDVRALYFDPPAPERQEPEAFMYQHEETGVIGFVDVQQIEWGFEKNNPRLHVICPLYRSPPEVAALQTTIARLEARITQLESEKEFAAATYQAARDRIAELESGRGEPVAVMYADGSVLTKAECGTAFEICCKVETPLFTAPPAPVAVVPDERAAFDAWAVKHGRVVGYNGWRNDFEVWQARACLDATAALNEGKL